LSKAIFLLLELSRFEDEEKEEEKFVHGCDGLSNKYGSCSLQMRFLSKNSFAIKGVPQEEPHIAVKPPFFAIFESVTIPSIAPLG
jgi:hypothetical protein